MNDTSPRIEEMINQIYLKKTGEEKILIALKMFETARDIVISSLPKDLSDKELKKELFLRFYGDEFDDIIQEKIYRRL
ncbi:MAG: hypothetical protein HND39_07530 [Ignavibacteriota bacterium]|nr:MAG: hypothetical protein EDM72_11125 [Chlorobiota bacterium]MBE7476126.1 hypothetical protein [Ignavibacteriales bacterium]MBL1124117.1 hypothetical protein [Ignavibacteriota bacterium]MCE7857277.1 hypothetical protein [Ignavibacteria bacterium CHB3]MCZ7614809.1 hypothetical protein [Ignavibacteriaceae bacterium]